MAEGFAAFAALLVIGLTELAIVVPSFQISSNSPLGYTSPLAVELPIRATPSAGLRWRCCRGSSCVVISPCDLLLAARVRARSKLGVRGGDRRGRADNDEKDGILTSRFVSLLIQPMHQLRNRCAEVARELAVRGIHAHLNQLARLIDLHAHHLIVSPRMVRAMRSTVRCPGSSGVETFSRPRGSRRGRCDASAFGAAMCAANDKGD